MGKYDTIWASFKNAANEVYTGTTKTVISKAIANELAEANRLKRVQLSCYLKENLTLKDWVKIVDANDLEDQA